MWSSREGHWGGVVLSPTLINELIEMVLNFSWRGLVGGWPLHHCTDWCQPSAIPLLHSGCLFQDPKRNRLIQWHDVQLQNGLARLSFPLTSEPTPGLYKVVVQKASGNNVERTFDVEEYGRICPSWARKREKKQADGSVDTLAGVQFFPFYLVLNVSSIICLVFSNQLHRNHDGW